MSQTTPHTCPSCQKTLAVPNQHLGKQIRCPGCKNAFRTEAVVEAVVISGPDPLMADNDLFGNDPFDQSLQNDPFADPGHQQPSPYATTSAQPAYLNSGAQPSARSSARPKKKSGKKRQANPDMTEAEQRAFGSGIFLLVVPIVATVLPLMGLQLRRLAKLGDAAPLAGIVLGLVGAGFIAYARRNQKDKILSPIIAGFFSVVVGVGGFLLLISLHSQSDLAGDEKFQGNGTQAIGSTPDTNFDREFLGDHRPTIDQGTTDFNQQHNDAMERHRKMAEDARRRSEEAMNRARERHDQIRKDMQNGNGFPGGDPFGGTGFGQPPGA